MLLAAFVGTASNIAVPVLEDEFPDASLATISWVVSAFNVAQVTFMLLGGRLADRRGRKKIFLTGIVVFTVGATLTAVAPTIEMVIAARVIQAIGVALMLPASLAAVLPEFPPERHGTVVSLWSSMGVFGAAVAPTVAAGLLALTSWRGVFFAAVPIALVAFALGRRVLTAGLVADDPPPLDIVGTVAGTVAIGGLVFAIVQGRIWGFTDPRIIAIEVAALAAGVVFWISSHRHPEPLLDFDLFRIRTFSTVTLAGALLSTSTSATWFLYPLFMTEVWGYSILQVGLAMTPGPLALVIFAPVAGRLVDQRGYRHLLVFGALMATLGTAWMAWRLRPDESYFTAFLPGTLAIGFGMAFMLGPANAAALRHVPQEELGAANAAYNMARMTGSALGVAITAAIIGTAESGDRLPSFQTGWWAMVSVMALAPLVLWLWYPAEGSGLALRFAPRRT